MLNIIFNYLIFPGFLFSVCIGLIAGWFDRKVTARLQWRKGPPWYQNFADILKLLGKETILPSSAKLTFLLAPCLGLASLVLVATILGRNIISPSQGFSGDLVVVLYLLVIPAISLILGASASRNPLASVGASREMKLILAYELPFILSIIAIIIKSGGAIQFGTILNHQALFGSNIFSWSGLIAFLVSVLCIQAKLGFVPFDVSEAEQEIMGGVLIEYSGLPLAIFKLIKAMLLYTLPVLLIILFLGQNLTMLSVIGKFIALLIVIILIKNTSPRLRIDQSLRFFWRIPTLLAILAVILGYFGL
ncbi:MAG: NADH-quinone oxidoreductase subunit H [Candidatus Omnitrophica bacterium]|nr:NADH-quinone oxidoreductase subunit H [Candidatus Omnitrophota bacterium]